MNELTNEEIAKVLAMYLGCKIKCSKSGALADVYHPHACSDYRHWQLVLTPLSEITDEHAIESAELINEAKYAINESFKIVKTNGRISVYSGEIAHESVKQFGFRYETKIYTDGHVVNGKPYSTIRQMPFEVHQYLISKGYSVPLFFGIDHWANGKTAIELGIAIPSN